MDIESIYQRQHTFFMQGKTRPREFRIQQLKALRKAVLEFEPQILDALHRDMRKPAAEAYGGEIMLIIQAIDYAAKHLGSWMRPTRVRTAWLHRPGKSTIIPEPYGSALIIGPWNFPFQLLLCPLVGAIAAGNTAILKPSEIAENSSRVIAELVDRTFAQEYITAVQGDADVARSLLDQKLDIILFTGSVAVGKIVMEKAARHLTPVTLELGGKNPCIVTKDTNLEKAAKRIAWGKFFNAGQSCVAPDYLLVQEAIKEPLMALIKDSIVRFYGKSIQHSNAYARIINPRHFQRLVRLMKDQNLFFGGETDEQDLFIAPTLLQDVHPESAIMQEEIFGPLLPIFTYKTIEEAVRFIQGMPKPLSLYLFSDDFTVRKRVLLETSSGSVNINETISQFTSETLPIGGVGESGMGGYHGERSFETFSHFKSVLNRSIRFDFSLKYPPYRTPLPILKRLLRLMR